MIRKIIQIDDNKCNGCGACAAACHEGAIGMVDGKAKLLRDDYCDGLGDCLPVCPMNAISFVERETASYHAPIPLRQTQLAQWPCQIRLVPVNAPYFQGADLLIAADCTAYAYANLHADFMRNKITLIGCPKLDAVDYREKLTAILTNQDLRSVTVIRMEVPCCGGMERAAQKAIQSSGKAVPLRIVTISTDGNILDANS